MHSVHSLADASPVCALNVPVFFLLCFVSFLFGVKVSFESKFSTISGFRVPRRYVENKDRGGGVLEMLHVVSSRGGGRVGWTDEAGHISFKEPTKLRTIC